MDYRIGNVENPFVGCVDLQGFTWLCNGAMLFLACQMWLLAHPGETVLIPK